MRYAVYIALDSGDDADEIVVAAASLTGPEFDFSVRAKSDPSESADAQLFFRIGGVEHPDEAISTALRIYQLARGRAGARPAEQVRVSLEPGHSL